MIKQLRSGLSLGGSGRNEKAKTFDCLNDNDKSKIEIISET